MKAKKHQTKSPKVSKDYRAPRVKSITVELEHGFAAGSTVQGTGMQQEHTEESQSQNVEW